MIIMKETVKAHVIQLPHIEDLAPSDAISKLYGIIRECLKQIGHLREENKAFNEEDKALNETAMLKEEIMKLKSRLNMDSHNSFGSHIYLTLKEKLM